MNRLWFIVLLLCIHTGSYASDREASDTETHPCLLQPIFHCAEILDNGGAIGHFGYNLVCPEGLEQVADLFIQIGDDNQFDPDPKDRGQPKVFVPGEHFDEFEAEFTQQEVNESKGFYWHTTKSYVRVDFSKTADEVLDCTMLPY